MGSKPIRLFSMVAMMLLMMLFTTMTAWACDVTLSGSDNYYTAQEDGVLTGSTVYTAFFAFVQGKPQCFFIANETTIKN